MEMELGGLSDGSTLVGHWETGPIKKQRRTMIVGLHYAVCSL